MYIVNFLKLLLFISNLCIVSISVQSLKTRCPPSTECINLSKCPAFLQKLTRQSINIIRENICGFNGVRSKVCCPDATSDASSSTTTPFSIGSTSSSLGGETLLPDANKCGRPSSADRIFGGGPAGIGAYPWVVALGYLEPGIDKVKFHCAGTLINSKYVLTAAHCVNKKELGRRRLSVLHIGDLDLSSEIDCQSLGRGATKCQPKHITSGFEEVVIHPQYNTRGRSSDDIALIRLNMTIDFQTVEAIVEPVCLPNNSFNMEEYMGGASPVAAGWGLTEHGNYSDILLRVDVELEENAQCKERYDAEFVTKQLCVGGNGLSDTCSGDSGGPLVIPSQIGPPFYQIGIVSFGPFPCALKNYPGVYTSVADYYDWIVQNLKP